VQFENPGTDREIFVYECGDKTLRGDPAVLWRRINEVCEDHGETIAGLMERWSKMEQPDGSLPEADQFRIARIWSDFQNTLVRIGRPVFNLPELDSEGNGITEAEVMKVLLTFLEYREKKDDSTESLPSGFGPSDGLPVQNPSTVSSSPLPDAPLITKPSGAFR
jgi:hypothetical protein